MILNMVLCFKIYRTKHNISSGFLSFVCGEGSDKITSINNIIIISDVRRIFERGEGAMFRNILINFLLSARLCIIVGSLVTEPLAADGQRGFGGKPPSRWQILAFLSKTCAFW